MRGLAHLHLQHPINDLARIEVAENAALEVVDLSKKFPSLGICSSQMASTFNRRSPSIHCSGTEKLPPPWRYFAAKPPPRKTVTRAESSFCSRAQARRWQ